MSWLPVGLSLMAALDSAIDYLMQPSATIRYGLILLVGTSSWLLLYPWVSMVTLPFYRRLNYFTAYEYLEARFDVRVRSLAAGIFIVWRLGWRATAIYVPCLRSGRHRRVLPVTIRRGSPGGGHPHTAIGGIKAVIWNDVMQFCVRFGRLAAVVTIAILSVPRRRRDLAARMAPERRCCSRRLPRPRWWRDRSVRAFFGFARHRLDHVFLMVGRMAACIGTRDRSAAAPVAQEARRAFVVNAAGDIMWIFMLVRGPRVVRVFQRHTLPPTDQFCRTS